MDIDKYLNNWIAEHTPHYRVIFDKMPKELRYPHHHSLEWAVQSWDKQPGWGKPDKMFGQIEVRYFKH